MKQESWSLGLQTNPDDIARDFRHKLESWAPAWAKSFHLQRFEHTDYNGHSVERPTGYARFEVVYLGTLKGVKLWTK